MLGEIEHRERSARAAHAARRVHDAGDVIPRAHDGRPERLAKQALDERVELGGGAHDVCEAAAHERGELVRGKDAALERVPAGPELGVNVT